MIKEIPGFTMYELSTDGIVYSKFSSGKALKPSYDKCGYPQFGLSTRTTKKFTGKHKIKKKFLHALMLETFVGPRPEGGVCRHLDGNKNNNSLENLKWGTIAENNKDKVKHGTVLFGQKNFFSKLTDEERIGIHILFQYPSWTNDAIGNIFGVTGKCIGQYRKGWIDKELKRENKG